MNTPGNRFEEPQRNRVFNLPLMLTIGAMILLGITTVTLGFVLWPEPKHWDEPTGTPGQETMTHETRPEPHDAGTRPDAR